MLNACEIDKQQVDVILHNNVSTLQVAVHEGLLSQRSITDSPPNTRTMVGGCCTGICRLRKSLMKVHALFQQNKKTIKLYCLFDH